MGIGSKELTYNFIKRGNKIYQEDYPEFKAEIALIAQDSMVIDYNELEEQFSVVYKKMPKPSGIKIEPKNKSFKFSGNNSIAYFEFLNDSLMVEYAQNTQEFSWKKWWIESFEGHEFLILNQIPEPQPIHIDSVAEQFIKISTLDTETNSYELTPILKNTELLKNIQGKWEFSTKSNIDSQIPRPPMDKFFAFNNFKITEELVITNESEDSIKHQWFLSSDNQTIFLFTSRSRIIRTWKIIELLDNKLVLEMPDLFILNGSGTGRQPRVTREYVRN